MGSGHGVRWRGTVSVTPDDRRVLTVSEDALVVHDPSERVERVAFDLRGLATDGVLLAYPTTMTLVDRGAPDGARLQLRALDPPSFDGIDWPPDVRELIEAQLAAAAAARARLTGQLARVVAVTIAGLGLLLLALVVVLVLA